VQDSDAAKRFYCDGLGFYVSGVTSGRKGRMIFIVHKQLPSFALGLHEAPADEPVTPHQDTLDIGVWNEDDWSMTRERMENLGLCRRPISSPIRTRNGPTIETRMAI
jgi:extradiol dioxygenase family protein